MSDSEDSNGPSADRPRKRRAVKACDECHRRKVKCEESSTLDLCSNCEMLGIDCTHFVQKKKRGPKSKLNQPEKLSDAKSLITTILSSPKTIVIPQDDGLIRKMLVNLARYGRELEKQSEQTLDQRSSASPPVSKPSPPFSDTSEDIQDQEESLTAQVHWLSLDNEYHNRHIGKSSHFMLLQTALDIRDEANGGAKMDTEGIKRSEFWVRAPWHRFLPEPDDLPYVFPEPELLRDLLTLYFEQHHIIYPILHRQTFERQVYVDRLHFSNPRFGAIVLVVCALGSRFSVDPRNLADGTSNSRSAGWKYFEQIRLIKTNYTASTLYDIQLYSLALKFLFPTPLMDVGWYVTSLAIRSGQEVGAHRKGNMTKMSTRTRLEQALWKRAFWNIVTTDLLLSIALGRPRSTREDDFDLEFPPECDDEYWEIPSNPEMEFVQPVDKPSHMAYWHYFMKLLRIAGLVKDHLFTTRKSAPWLDSSSETTDRIVMELDSALNSWVDGLPDYLRWDPNRQDDALFMQTVMLHSNYYWVQIQIHKMFIRPGLHSTGNFPSLAICCNAARSYVHMLQVYHARRMPVLPHFIAPTFVVATMLLINLWTSIRVKSSYDSTKDMADVQHCLMHLGKYETRFEAAGRLKDVLEAVISAGQLPSFPQQESLKRTRDSPSFQRAFEEGFTRRFAGSQRVSNTLHPLPEFDQCAPTFDANALQEPSTMYSVAAPSAFDSFYNMDASGQQPLGFGGQHEPQYNSGLCDGTGCPSDPNHEDWTSFMSQVDELLAYINV